VQCGPGTKPLVAGLRAKSSAEADDTFCEDMLFFTVLKMTMIFAFIAYIRGCTTIRYINLRFTYLLTYLLTSVQYETEEKSI